MRKCRESRRGVSRPGQQQNGKAELASQDIPRKSTLLPKSKLVLCWKDCFQAWLPWNGSHSEACVFQLSEQRAGRIPRQLKGSVLALHARATSETKGVRLLTFRLRDRQE